MNKDTFKTISLIQKVLYDYPLYSYEENGEVNCFVFGYNVVTCAFVDLAFELSQVSNYKINIIIVTDNDSDKSDFLETRPEFNKFFSVDDIVVDDSYGKVIFKTINTESLKKELMGLLSDNKFTYYFIDSGNYRLNAKVASICKSCKNYNEENSVINCISKTQRKPSKRVNYIWKDDSIENHNDYLKLREMAFNSHLAWQQNALTDVKKEFNSFSNPKDFESKYNNYSSFKFVLSTKYRLQSLGIDYCSPTAALQFCDFLNNNPNEIDLLAANEHKRWNVSLICDIYTKRKSQSDAEKSKGFRAPSSLENYVFGSENKENKYHFCLARSKFGNQLEHWNNNHFILWDSASEDKLNKLDELDRVSVEIHRLYKKKAKEIISNNIYYENEIDRIGIILKEYKDVKKVFDTYVFCIKEIISGNTKETKVYNYYKEQFQKSLKRIPSTTAEEIEGIISTIDRSTNIIVESERYIDYKKYDYDLIKSIPFILSYNHNIHIGIPLCVKNSKTQKNNTKLFNNVAAALLIHPAKITFFYDYEKSEKEVCLDALKYAIKCCESHNLNCEINVCLITEEVIGNDIKEFEKLVEAKNLFVVDYSDFGLFDKVAKIISQQKIDYFEKNKSNTSTCLKHMNIYNTFPHYEYNSIKNSFRCYGECDFLKHLVFKPRLRITDLFELDGNIISYDNPDFLNDYSFFWSLYFHNNESKKIWKRLCNKIGKCFSKEICRFNKQAVLEPVNKSYLLEKCCVESLTAILDEIRNAGIYVDYKIEPNSGSVYSLEINASTHVHSGIKNLISKPDLLQNKKRLRFIHIYNSLVINYKSLIAENLEVRDEQNETGNIKALDADEIRMLKKIEAKGYIYNLVINDKKCSFVCSSSQVASTFSTGGNLFELYVYYSLLVSGCFDEIATGVEVDCNNVKNEIDIVLTKGYSSAIIECKAMSTLDVEFYYKLFVINNAFGINSVPIIIGDTNETETEQAERNKFIRIRGDADGIKTIYNHNDIKQVSEVVNNILVEKTNEN